MSAFSPTCGTRQPLPLHLPQKRHHLRTIRPKDKSQWRFNSLTCHSAVGRVSDHPQRNDQPTRWGHDVLLTYPVCRSKPSLRPTATLLSPPRHQVSNRMRRWDAKQPFSTVLRSDWPLLLYLENDNRCPHKNAAPKRGLKCAWWRPKKQLYKKRLREARQDAVIRRGALLQSNFFCSFRSQYCTSHSQNCGAAFAADDHGPQFPTQSLKMPLILAPYQIWSWRLSRWWPPNENPKYAIVGFHHIIIIIRPRRSRSELPIVVKLSRKRSEMHIFSFRTAS